MARLLHVVHCVDTEGPLHESLEATFERVRAMTGVSLAPSRQNLAALQAGAIDLGGSEEAVRVAVAPRLLAYNDDWGKVDAMLDELMSPAYRLRHADPAGRPWTFNWFCVDHVGYDVNPRRRDIGYHNVFDHYRARLAAAGGPDEVHWHAHPMPPSREAHRNATSYLRSPHVFETLARRILEREYFPSVFRPGFHVERPDSHWLLEQYVPFDYGNQAMPAGGIEEAQADLAGGRWGDWRRAPDDWSPYHPAHDDYQARGACRRVIFRCLNVGTRLRLLDEAEVRRAFARAAAGRTTALAFTDHDFRDMRPDVTFVHELVRRVAADFPTVEWRNSGALAAARSVLELAPPGPLELSVRVETGAGSARVDVAANHAIFGPQPFFAVRTWGGGYAFDNLDVQEPFRAWSYVFDEQTFPPRAVEAFGFGAADAYGQTVAVRATL
ncbi:MAG: hypothetical protein H3C53_00940 [Trueperaceae bacterium]|nr:hypothetical protein [Trueperaceae bacterium]